MVLNIGQETTLPLPLSNQIEFGAVNKDCRIPLLLLQLLLPRTASAHLVYYLISSSVTAAVVSSRSANCHLSERISDGIFQLCELFIGLC